jgi:uncharacterized protein YecE (DUF72 family)
VVYLGPGLPAEDIAEARRRRARAPSTLSLGATPGDRITPRELRRLRTLLPRDVAIVVEGAAAEAHRGVLREIGASVLRDVPGCARCSGARRARPAPARCAGVPPLRRVHVGTSGWSYAHWTGVLYPEGLLPRQRLDHYLPHFRTVELNASYYRWPRDAAFTRWRRRLPDGFLLSVKAPGLLTHVRKLYAPERWLTRIGRALERLGDRAGPLLVQLSPLVPLDEARLAWFLAHVPPGVRVAVEMRHPSWHRESVFALLARHGAAYCVMSGAGLPWRHRRLDLGGLARRARQPLHAVARDRVVVLDAHAHVAVALDRRADPRDHRAVARRVGQQARAAPGSRRPGLDREHVARRAACGRRGSTAPGRAPRARSRARARAAEERHCGTAARRPCTAPRRVEGRVGRLDQAEPREPARDHRVGGRLQRPASGAPARRALGRRCASRTIW